MTAAQLLSLWAPVLVLGGGGGLWRVIALLVKIAGAIEVVPGLVTQGVEHDRRLTAIEGKVS